MDGFAAKRERMVEQQIARRGVRDPRVLGAMRRIPREAFVAEELRDLAYEDSPLPIGAGQTISQPYIVALMIEAAQPGPTDRVLDIGGGSGYAAAVVAALAERVYTIERHAELAELARARYAELGYRNIEVRTGDGTEGWPDAAPFDAIIVAAGGPSVPATLLRQLTVGGRLVMPVGDQERQQRLVKVTRTTADHYEHEDLGAVRFVPLIGSHGWSEHGGAGEATATRSPKAASITLAQAIGAAIEPLPALDSAAFGRPFERYASARVVLLGEASHGTAEFYQARAAITRHLIEAHGFRMVALEADWPDAAALNRHVRRQPAHAEDARAFQRFPTWMWRNHEFDAFASWLQSYNAARQPSEQAGIYGLDLYSLQRSMHAVIDYLDRVDPEAAQVARRRYGCLTPWAQDPAQYGRMALSTGYALCEKAVVQILRELLEHRLAYASQDNGSTYLDAAQNARLVSDAEAYYRAMYYGAAESWNLRDRHMFETLEHLLHAHGAGAKVVVWAHNSHIGDARHTEMGQSREELNLGQLCRERFGDEVALIGLGTHTGTVAAADNWDEPMQVMRVQPSRADSYERLFHDAGVPRGLLDLHRGQHTALCERLLPQRLERFIGVIYRPDTERWSHYTQATLPRQFDGYVWFDETQAVHPLPTHERHGVPDTWPFGL